jgi:DNA gyrase subunit A
VIGAVNLQRKGTTILVATQKGFGKRSETDEYRISHRGGKGIFTVKTSEKTGKMVAIKEVVNTDDVVIVTSDGMIIRQHASDIRVAGRNTQGVHLIRLKEGDSVAAVAAVVAEEEEDKQISEQESKKVNGKNGNNEIPPPISNGKGEVKKEKQIPLKLEKTKKTKKPEPQTKKKTSKKKK